MREANQASKLGRCSRLSANHCNPITRGLPRIEYRLSARIAIFDGRSHDLRRSPSAVVREPRGLSMSSWHREKSRLPRLKIQA